LIFHKGFPELEPILILKSCCAMYPMNQDSCTGCIQYEVSKFFPSLESSSKYLMNNFE